MSEDTCATCGANMRSARFEHRSAVKGDDDWSDILACTNEQCMDYVNPSWWHDTDPGCTACEAGDGSDPTKTHTRTGPCLQAKT